MLLYLFGSDSVCSIHTWGLNQEFFVNCILAQVVTFDLSRAIHIWMNVHLNLSACVSGKRHTEWSFWRFLSHLSIQHTHIFTHFVDDWCYVIFYILVKETQGNCHCFRSLFSSASLPPFYLLIASIKLAYICPLSSPHGKDTSSE